ncbi:Protein SirB1, N-terminal, partial [Dillenia turbinata]
TFPSSNSTFSRFQLCPTSSSSHVVKCKAQHLAKDPNFVLHDALDASGVDTGHARVARDGFCSQIRKLSNIERETSIAINRCVDLAKTALFIAAEDDSLVSHSSLPLTVDAFIERLDDLSIGYCSHYSSSFRSSPENFLGSLERYLFVNKGFRRADTKIETGPRALYLHSVLTHRSGSSVMLSLIYSEMLKMLRLWGLLDFDAEIYFPHDLYSLPRGYPKKKSKLSDHPHIMTSEYLLVEILRNLKDAFWPFRHDPNRSLFLRAAHAANCLDKPDIAEESGFELASAKAAQHRIDRGVWTSVHFGDMRRALSACERLILLETDPVELRDYSVLLYHCRFYTESLKYLKLYRETTNSSTKRCLLHYSSDSEEDAVDKLMVRLNLILMEEGWSRPSYVRSFLGV